MKRMTNVAGATTTPNAERPDLLAWRIRHEIRRSNAAQPITSKRQYRRTRKHRNSDND
ncbi:hypothetical protein AB0H76_38870 [Nocardia sp. NPDC050712]|uniref:hypothetical protein n=1 Tax=Nocardia sp. NPDC050712 TaxID=3155518 RepID=UPI003402DC18